MSQEINRQLFETGSYVDGKWLTSENSFSVFNPATGEEICKIADASADDADKAVAAAKAALPSWRLKTAKERAAILRKWYELLMQHQHDLALILTLEQGKPLAEAMGEIAYGANYVEWFAEEGKRVYGDTIPSQGSNSRIVVIKQGVGVVSAITPWNFPNAMIARKVAPALAAGCTFVVKAASETPLSALAMCKLAEQAGVPAGVFNVIATTDSRGVGKVLTEDPRIAKFSFTGSTATGKLLLSQCAKTVKKTSMELGGNAPFIVFDDADLDAAVAGLMISKFRNAGQTCVCTNRVLVQESILEEFKEKLKAAVSQLKIGSGLDQTTQIGPLITQKAVNGVKELVDDAIAGGAKVVVGGEVAEHGDHYYCPTVLDEVSPNMKVASEEIFGPVAPLIKFQTEQQAIELANDTDVGLASYIYTRDIGRIWRVSEALEYGMVGINEGIISNEMAPFGGIKESGTGREGSKYGLDDYLEIKYLCMGGIDS